MQLSFSRLPVHVSVPMWQAENEGAGFVFQQQRQATGVFVCLALLGCAVFIAARAF